MADEEKDYKRKDSLEQAKKNPKYMDSLQRIRNKITLANIVLLGQSFQSERKRTSLSIPSLFELLSFNPAEGWVAAPASANRGIEKTRLSLPCSAGKQESVCRCKRL